MKGWIVFAFIAMIAASLMMLVFKTLTQKGVPLEVINFYFFLTGTIVFFNYSLIRQVSMKLPSFCFGYFITLGILALVFNHCNLSAIKFAPNPGYVAAIGSLRVIFVAISAFFLFESELTLNKSLGCISCIIGIWLIAK